MIAGVDGALMHRTGNALSNSSSSSSSSSREAAGDRPRVACSDFLDGVLVSDALRLLAQTLDPVVKDFMSNT